MRHRLPKFLIFFTLIAAANTYAARVPVEVTYLDAENEGVNSPKIVTLHDGQKVSLGEFRKNAIEHVVRAVSLQFNTSQTFFWDVKFNNHVGFNALTYGPPFGEVRDSDVERDDYGVLKKGRWFPVILMDTLLGVSHRYDERGAISETHFADYDGYPMTKIIESSGQPELYSIIYHELIHFYGFADSACLGNCITGRIARTSHMSERLWFVDNNENIVRYDDASLDDKEQAGMSVDGLLFLGSNATQLVALSELAGGYQQTNGKTYIEMFATPTEGIWDGQVGSHLSDAIQPEQLMRSSAAYTQDMGMAAYVLCDLGWCRNQGQVIDLEARAELDENASDENSTHINITFSNLTNAIVDKVKAQVRLDDSYSSISMDSNSICTLSNYVLTCEMALNELGQEKVSIAIGPLQDVGYSIAGEIYSDDYDVDRNGFNNILDTTLMSQQTNNSSNNSDESTSSAPAQSEGKSGGVVELWLMLFAGIVCFYRWRWKNLQSA